MQKLFNSIGLMVFISSVSTFCMEEAFDKGFLAGAAVGATIGATAGTFKAVNDNLGIQCGISTTEERVRLIADNGGAVTIFGGIAAGALIGGVIGGIEGIAVAGVARGFKKMKEDIDERGLKSVSALGAACVTAVLVTYLATHQQ